MYSLLYLTLHVSYNIYSGTIYCTWKSEQFCVTDLWGVSRCSTAALFENRWQFSQCCRSDTFSDSIILTHYNSLLLTSLGILPNSSNRHNFITESARVSSCRCFSMTCCRHLILSRSVNSKFGSHILWCDTCRNIQNTFSDMIHARLIRNKCLMLYLQESWTRVSFKWLLKNSYLMCSEQPLSVWKQQDHRWRHTL